MRLMNQGPFWSHEGCYLCQMSPGHQGCDALWLLERQVELSRDSKRTLSKRKEETAGLES